MASIRNKITLSILISILVPLMVATFFSVYFLLDKVEQEALNNVRQDAQVASMIYLNKAKEIKSLSKLTAKDRIVVVALQHNIPNKLAEHLAPLVARESVTQVTVMDKEGRVVVDVPGWNEPGEDLGQDPFVQRALMGSEPSGSERVPNPAGENPAWTLSLTAASPIMDRDDFFQIGVLRIRYHVGIREEMIHKISGAIQGRVDLFLDSERVASSSVLSDEGSGKSRELDRIAIQQTFQENRPHEQVIVAEDGYLAEFQPIAGIDYQPVGTMAIHTPAREYYRLRIRSLASILAIAAFALVVGLLIGYRLQRGITGPIIELTEQTAAVAQGDFSRGPIDIPSRDEVGKLASSFNKMTQDLIQYIEHLKTTTAERERMAKELEIAHQIQQHFLPSSFPKLGHTQIFGKSLPAREVGGDFFDVFLIDSNRLGLVIADVSGKGVPAAMYMAQCRSMLRITALSGYEPQETLSRLNQFLSQDNDECFFITTFFGILDLSSRVLTYANAGHDYPLIYRHDPGDIESLPGTGGTALGIVEDFHYKTARVQFFENDIAFLYTDGIVDALNGLDESFGLRRLRQAILRGRDLSPDRLGKEIQQEIQEFVNQAEQFDDITYLIVRFDGNPDQGNGTLQNEGTP
ncbi:MAG: SpoIIE family protein phosphatase [Desulfobacteraceae bacterium]|jgi:serine phosphatase RsbU (regulator of sigma subunit)/HAMP domain-containing protein